MKLSSKFTHMLVWGRIIWWNVFAFNLALPGFIYGFCSALDSLQRVKLTNVSGYLYNDENKTSGTLTFEADQPCSGYVRVSFYGEDGGFLLSKQYEVSLSGRGTSSGGTSVWIDGVAETYVVDGTRLYPLGAGPIDPGPSVFYSYCALPLTLAMGIRSCLLKQRKYDVGGISVRCYDGWWKHSLYINDELVDQLSAPYLLVPWKLTYQDSHFYEATFSPSHSITLKVDGKLVQPLG